MKTKTTIRSSQSGWVVYFNNDVNSFVPFRSDEPQRLLKFLCENVAGIKIDEVVTSRLAEKEKAKDSLGLPLSPNMSELQ